MSEDAYWLEALVGYEVVILDASGAEKKVPTKSLRGSQNHIGLYFSAHWCPPCRQFTPRLAALYEELKAGGKGLEIIYVSSDRKKSDFLEYFATMPWAAVPFEAQQLTRALGHKHGVAGIPTLVIYSPQGEIITKDAVSGIRGGATFPWNGPVPGRVSKLPRAAVILGGLIVWLCIKFGIAYLKKLGIF